MNPNDSKWGGISEESIASFVNGDQTWNKIPDKGSRSGLNKVSTQIVALEDKVNKLESELNDKILKASEEIDKKTKKLEDKFKNDTSDIKKEFIGIFGIFAALLTFVSVEFKLLQAPLGMAKASGLTVLLTATMLLFISSIKFLFIDKNKDFKDFKKGNSGILFIIIALFLLAGIFFGYDRWNHERLRDEQSVVKTSKMSL